MSSSSSFWGICELSSVLSLGAWEEMFCWFFRDDDCPGFFFLSMPASRPRGASLPRSKHLWGRNFKKLGEGLGKDLGRRGEGLGKELGWKWEGLGKDKPAEKAQLGLVSCWPVGLRHGPTGQRATEIQRANGPTGRHGSACPIWLQRANVNSDKKTYTYTLGPKINENR